MSGAVGSQPSLTRSFRPFDAESSSFFLSSSSGITSTVPLVRNSICSFRVILYFEFFLREFAKLIDCLLVTERSLGKKIERVVARDQEKPVMTFKDAPVIPPIQIRFDSPHLKKN